MPAATSAGRDQNAPRFIADERTNAIVVIATKNVLREVERIITLLDYKRKARAGSTYRLATPTPTIAQTLEPGDGLPGAGGAAGRARLAHRHPRTSLTGLGRARTPRARRWAGSAAERAAQEGAPWPSSATACASPPTRRPTR